MFRGNYIKRQIGFLFVDIREPIAHLENSFYTALIIFTPVLSRVAIFLPVLQSLCQTIFLQVIIKFCAIEINRRIRCVKSEHHRSFIKHGYLQRIAFVFSKIVIGIFIRNIFEIQAKTFYFILIPGPVFACKIFTDEEFDIDRFRIFINKLVRLYPELMSRYTHNKKSQQEKKYSFHLFFSSSSGGGTRVGASSPVSSSIFLSFEIFPVSSSMRISFASFKNSEANIKSFNRWFLLKMISFLLPSHSFCPSYI